MVNPVVDRFESQALAMKLTARARVRVRVYLKRIISRVWSGYVRAANDKETASASAAISSCREIQCKSIC